MTGPLLRLSFPSLSLSPSLSALHTGTSEVIQGSIGEVLGARELLLIIRLRFFSFFHFSQRGELLECVDLFLIRSSPVIPPLSLSRSFRSPVTGLWCCCSTHSIDLSIDFQAISFIYFTAETLHWFYVNFGPFLIGESHLPSTSLFPFFPSFLNLHFSHSERGRARARACVRSPPVGSSLWLCRAEWR